jgi:raffinose/stachyose/melibiose transport system substrate-binding protein
MKKGTVLVALAALAVFSGCGKTAAKPAEKVKLTVFNNQSQIVQGVLEGITEEFQKENPNIEVDFQSVGKDYESMMKVKMASKDLPDVFSTHGWAVMRYGEYLTDLSKEEWAPRVKSSIRSVVTDSKGKLCVLPMDLDITGMTYNKAMFEEYGLSVPKNFDELISLCETIKTKSGGKVTPLHYGGGDSWPIGGYYDFNSTSYFVSDSGHDYRSSLLDGSFDWTKYDIISENFLKLKKMKALNQDILTAKYTDSVEALANGVAAIGGCYGAYIIAEVKKINPSFKGGMMPIPAYYPGDTPTFVGGERTTWGVWKDSKNLDAAKKYVAFFARPENLKKVAEANGIPAGLDGVETNLGELAADYEAFKDARIFPYFDRAYLPNGMWDVMCKNGQDLLAGAITPRGYSDNMKKEYERLRAAAQ